MQITINEIEIKAAIRNHVLGMIAVREDMRIDIDLKATRKEEGYTAVIDITPPDKGPGGEVTEPEAKTEPAPAPAKEAAKVEAKAEKPKAVAETVPEPVEVIEPASAEPEVAPAVEAVAEPEAEPESPKAPVKPLFGKKALKPTPAAEAQDNTAPLDEATEPKKDAPRSIFAGLPKPVNTKTEAT